MKKRIPALLLTLLFVLPLAVSCGSEPAQTPSQTTAAEAGTPTETTEAVTEDPLADNLPAKDYDGYKFRFYTFMDYDETYAPESQTGDVVNDAVYLRNQTVEERFNIRITSINSGADSYTKQIPAIETSILSGGDDFDVAVNNGKSLTGQSLLNYFVNLYDIDAFDFSKPWWSQKLVDDLTFMNCMFVFSNNMAYEEFAASKVFYFNKDKVAALGIDDPYKTVFDGLWTLDRFISTTKDVYEDLNGNGEHDTSDFYGLLTTSSHNAWQVVLDIPEWEKTADSLRLVANSEKANTAYEKLFKFYYQSNGLYLWHSYSAADKPMREMFINGQGLFSFGFVGDSGIHYRATDVDYGIVPFPKYDENQDDYIVFFGVNSSNMFAIPITSSDLERSGIILEAMSAEGYKQLIPAYYEVALKAKYLRDEDSVRMLDLITAARTISFAYCYDNYSKASVGFGMCLSKTNSLFSESYATFFAGRENLANERIQVVMEAFKKAVEK